MTVFVLLLLIKCIYLFVIEKKKCRKRLDMGPNPSLVSEAIAGIGFLPTLMPENFQRNFHTPICYFVDPLRTFHHFLNIRRSENPGDLF